MNDRERFAAWVRDEPVDRPPYWLFWVPWNSTMRRWRGEGMPAEIQKPEDLWTYFDSDLLPIQAVVPANTGPCPKIEATVLSEDENSVTFVDSWGIKRRDLKHMESMSQFLEHPVRSREDWEAFKASYLDPDHPDRLTGNWLERCRNWHSQGYPIQLCWYPDAGIFGPYRWLLGDEEALLGFYTMPDLAHDIMDHMTTLYLGVFEKVVSDIEVDIIHYWEDHCYRGGPLMSPSTWEEFMAPNYRRIKAFADRHQIAVLSVDTDGNPDLITPAMIKTGVNFLYPMEVAAGCDVNEWRRKYPKLAIMGGIDKRALSQGRREIDQELARIRPALDQGRYIPSLDHLIPDDVPWDNYCYFAERLRDVVGKV
ncbi:MAG: hypothetical protein GY759_05075 [Chloroflexi bacterium]|nr:hypothetical protein [Chloroflexota bacterium]